MEHGVAVGEMARIVEVERRLVAGAVDVRQGTDEPVQDDVDAKFLSDLPAGALLSRLARLHEPADRIPVPSQRGERTPG